MLAAQRVSSGPGRAMTTDAQCADTRDQEQVPPRALPGGRGGGLTAPRRAGLERAAARGAGGGCVRAAAGGAGGRGARPAGGRRARGRAGRGRRPALGACAPGAAAGAARGVRCLAGAGEVGRQVVASRARPRLPHSSCTGSRVAPLRRLSHAQRMAAHAHAREDAAPAAGGRGCAPWARLRGAGLRAPTGHGSRGQVYES